MKLHRSFSTKKDKVYFTFNCPTYAEHGSAGCSSRVKRKADLDNAVLESIRTQMNVFMDTAHIIKSLLAQKQSNSKRNERRKSKSLLNSKIKSLHSAVSNLYIDMKDGLLTEEEYLMQKKKYQDQISELEHTLDELNQDETETMEQIVGTKQWSAIVEKYADANELSKELLDACIEQIKVHADGSLDITFNYMQEFKELLDTTERLKKEVA